MNSVQELCHHAKAGSCPSQGKEQVVSVSWCMGYGLCLSFREDNLDKIMNINQIRLMHEVSICPLTVRKEKPLELL